MQSSQSCAAIGHSRSERCLLDGFAVVICSTALGRGLTSLVNMKSFRLSEVGVLEIHNNRTGPHRQHLVNQVNFIKIQFIGATGGSLRAAMYLNI